MTKRSKSLIPLAAPMILSLAILVTSCSAPPIRVVYLVNGQGFVPETDLAKHPEIVVTNSYDEFKQAARQRITLWIDKNSTHLINPDWINSMPQTSYPIIVIGYNNPILAFKKSLGLCCFLGPINPDFSTAEGGFSVIEKDGMGPTATLIMLQGFNQPPTLDILLRISNDLLDGKFHPTPSSPPVHATFLPPLLTPRNP